MNLDSLSFALSHISYSVANLTKKNYKSSVAEITHLKARHGAEADRHLFRCLFSHVDFSGDGKGSGKDFYQTQHLIQECNALIAKPNFVSILCYSIDNPLHHQKTVKPSPHLLPQLSRLLKLSRLQEVVFGIALLRSSVPEIRQYAATFIRQKLPHLLASHLDPESLTESGLQDAAVEVIYLLLVCLRGKENYGVSADQKEAFLKALQTDYPQERVPVVLDPLLYPDCEDQLLARLDPDAVPLPQSMMDTKLEELVKEVGYGFTASIEDCRSTLMQFGVREISPASIARVLGAMSQTPSGLADQIGVQTLGTSGPWNEAKDKLDASGPQNWNVDIFVQVVRDLAPHMNWRDVVKNLDYPGFSVSSKAGLHLLVHALNRGLQDIFPIELIYQLWANTEGQLSFITQSLKSPDVFCFADYACNPVVIDILKAPPDEENRELVPWKSLNLVETLLRLSDAGHYQTVSELFKMPLQQCSDILVLALLQIQTWNTLKHELLSTVMPIFLGNHPNSAVVLHYAWHCQNQSTTIRTLVMHAMAEWYMRGEHHDQSRLSRILDVAQDLKALSMLLNATPFAFVIDLACLASRREYLKLDKWLSDKIREHGEPFMHACVHFLKVRCPQLVGSPDDGKLQSKAQQLPSETLTTMLACMQACLGNVSKELSDAIMTMMNNASIVLKSRQMGQPPPPAASGQPKVSLPQALPGLPNPAPNPMDQLGGISVGPLGGSVSAASSSTISPFPSSLGSLTAAPGSPAKSFQTLVSQSVSQAPSFNPMPGLPSQLSGQSSQPAAQIFNPLQGLPTPPSVSGQPTSQAQLFTPMGLPSLPAQLSNHASSQPASFNPMLGLPTQLSNNMSALGQGMAGAAAAAAAAAASGQSPAFNPMQGPSMPTQLAGQSMQGLASQFQGLGMSTTMSSTLTSSRMTPTLGALSAQAAVGGLKQPQGPANPVDRLRQGTSATPGGGDVSSIFPAMNQQFSKEIEDKANSYFQRIYNHPPHPTISIDEVLDMLKRFKDSPVKEEREVFSCMLRNLFEEYRFFPQYPDKELNTTAVLFGGIIEQGLVTYMDLGIALRYVLEALKKPHASKMYFFGIAALDKFRTRLKDYPQYCQHLASIPHFTNFPQHLKEYVECGARSEEPVNRPQGPVITRSLTPVSVAATTTTTAATTTAVTTTSTTPTPTPSAIARPTPAPARPSIATATSIETLLAGTEGKEEIAIPPETLQDKVFFIFNNLSLANMEQKASELRENLTDEHTPWVSQYLVMKRASIEANFHTLYANFIDHLKNAEFLPLVIRETYRNIKVLLRSDKGVANFSDRSLLKNLGHWLGMLTLAKNKPIMHLDIDLKSLLYEAYHKGSQELLYVVPFVAKVIESSAKSKVFRPPNPWTLGIMNVLAELHQEPDLKLNLKFEIEVLCKNLNIDISDLKPAQYLKDLERLNHLEQQLSAPRPAKECSTPQPEEPLQINMPTPTVTAVTSTVAPTPTTATTSSVIAPPQPLFAYQEINTLSMAGLAPHIQISEQLGLFQAHPQMKQFVRAAIERSVQELLPPVVERSIKIGLTTCEQIVKKDFALDPEEVRMRGAAHNMVRFMTAGMALITCREPLLLSINTNLKTTFLQTLRGATQPQKELIEQASQVLAQDNVELACAFIQKTAVEKAIPEIDKRLATDYDLRKHARNESRRYCDPVVLTYQAERMPEQIRLKVGGVTPHQIAVYEEFARNVPGFMSTAQETGQTGQYMAKPMQTHATDEISQIYDKIAREIEQHLHLSIAPPNSPLVQALHGLLESVILARNSREIVTALSLLQKAVDGLLEGLTLVPTDQEMMLRFRDCHLLVLKGLQDHRAYGPQWTNKHVTKRLIECRDEHRYNIEAIDCLIRSHLVNMQQYDMHVAQSMENGLNYMAVAFAMQLVQRFCVEDKSTTQLNESQQVSFQADFYNTIETLARIATHSRQAPEGLTTLIDTIRQHNDGGLLDRAPGGPTSMMHSGISQAREFDDPPGLHEKTEYLLREWVNMYHSPGAGRDSTKAFSAFVTQMHQQGILKTDDLITRFFRLCTEMCVDLCYRALSDQTHSPTLVRAKCFHTLDAFVRLIALLVKHSGDTSNTVTKINLLNKVLGIVAGVLLQDHEVRYTDFQQLPYHRIFIMLFIELNAPEHVLESINFQVLTAFCNTFHILRPSKAPGFSYAWLELVSHRVFIGRMLAITPEQRGWNMYAQLLIDLFKFLSPFLRNAELTKPTQLLYKGSLRVLLVLLHDFPEFLCDYHYAFCDVIPPNCIQMRNLILSAFPRNMRLPDPFTPNLKVDMLPEIGHPPRIMTNIFTMIQPASFKKDLDSYLKIRSPVTFLSDLRSNLQVSTEPGMRYNIPLINALVLYVGMQAIAHIHSKSQTPSMTTIAHSSHMDIFQNLSVDLDTEGRYLFLNAIANQLRYPNSHTHYFSCTLLYLFAEANTEAIQEQITRVLLERLIVNRPHPWGLLITFIEMIRNPQFKFWNHEFVHCAPEIEKLFESVARSCMQPKQGQVLREPEAHEVH